MYGPGSNIFYGRFRGSRSFIWDPKIQIWLTNKNFFFSIFGKKLVKNRKIKIFVCQSNLDFKVSNERSGPHEPAIKNIWPWAIHNWNYFRYLIFENATYYIIILINYNYQGDKLRDTLQKKTCFNFWFWHIFMKEFCRDENYFHNLGKRIFSIFRGYFGHV